MKFTILSKYQKIGLSVLMSVTIVFLVFMGLLIHYTGNSIVDVWNDLYLLIKILLVILGIMLILGCYFTLFLVFTHVEINENGIELHFGKLVLNKMKWQEIQWAETFYEENIYVRRQHITVAKNNNLKYKKVRHSFVQNLTRKQITFLYDKKATDLIKEHCNCFIYKQDLICD